ncbi:MAG TPA: shikimate kinase [Acidimicrobiales bacterium]|nr:shikimate kinase [Acidimicrobiales bacterium]
MGDHLLLVGMMGAGKSTVGVLLARRMARPHVDIDGEIERDARRPVAEIFSSEGEPAFRELEKAKLRSVLSSPAAAVVSVGGGAVIDAANRALMRDSAAVVWLRARPDTLWSRVADSASRPLLGTPESATRRTTLEELNDARRPLYEEVATFVVDTDDLDPEQVAEEVLAVVGRTVP